MAEPTSPLVPPPQTSYTDTDGEEALPVSQDPRDCQGTMGGVPVPTDDPNPLHSIGPMCSSIAARFTDPDGTQKKTTTKRQGNVKRATVKTTVASKNDARGSESLAQWASALLKPEPEECEAEGCREATNVFTQPVALWTSRKRKRRHATPLATVNRTKKRKLCKVLAIPEEAIDENVKAGNEVDGSDS